MAVLGSRLGTLILVRVSEAQFRRASEIAILALGALCVVRGLSELMPRWGWA